ncbi:hypothetical protein MRB53_025352 [Persea americana]|uniref:Uncharacterized protein n=1 Tax=Persea americana TaxID=3435 RepID=A0ACC2LFM3_PERAE|nr:hypothetical protein MRB53_025352 [Persea americana]|eukprot:TRINITY_DN36078_c0_g1_i1.p1 TRINITY_DN36078_c0_g1~~TRINITY_DN36078_c0_g1_i1.p1  ORF type:complete len:401 (-),score=49.63 TRINITY_DN36078_c0_g1_i1:152-1354(-)
MSDLQRQYLQIKEGCEEPDPLKDGTVINQTPLLRHWKWWLVVALNITLLTSGQSAGVLLLRFYYNRGGNSIWMATLTQSAGFPILLLPLLITFSMRTRTRTPLILIPSTSTNTNSSCSYNTSDAAAVTTTKSPSVVTLTLIYVFLGLLMAGNNVMFSYGLLYLPVSTYSLICATQLAFNAPFSFLFNSQKFTPLIFNSIVLLTFSASLLAVHTNSDGPTGVSAGKHVVGFLFTLSASAGYALWLALTQRTTQKILKESFSMVFKLLIYTSGVATCACVIGLFASGEWKRLKGEMEEYGKGRVSYVMTLVWTAVSWQVTFVGTVGLSFWVSSLFTMVISTMALPIIPILAVIFFHDKMDGVKILALLIAIWGFLSYIYQHYLDDYKSKTRTDENDLSDPVV